MKSYDLIVIGAGPGGTDLAKDAASRGWKTALIEKDKIGGTCLNRGCIPTKALLHLSEVQASLESLATSGLCDEATVEKQRKALRSNATLDFRDRIVETQQQGLDQSIKKNKNIDFYEDFGQIIESGKVQLKESQEILEAEHIVLATGSVPQLIPIPGVDLAKVYTSDDFLDPSLPREIWDGLQNIVIIGGGVIGVEMADYLARSGREVTIIEALDRILPNMDVALSRGLAQSFKKRGIVVLSKAKVQSIEETGSSLTVHYVTAKEEEVEITCDAVLMATGRKAYTEGVVSPELAISMNGRTFAINERFECSIPNVYAIGDTRAGSMQLAHAASQDAKYLMEILEAKKAGVESGVESGVGSAEESGVESRAVIPNCVYTSPELAQVGMTEGQAKEQGISIISGKANSLSNARNLIAGGERGFVNLVFASESLELLGAQWQGERATELIEELALAINQKLTIDDLLNQCFAHPSFVEILISALQAAKAKVKEI